MLQAKASQFFEFVTQSGTRTSRSRTNSLIADARFDLDSIVSEEWCSKNTVNSAYWENFASCTAHEWETWLSSGQSGLPGFVPLEPKALSVTGKSQLRRLLRERGFDREPFYEYVTSQFLIKDWDFAEEHWRHWEDLAGGDKAIWGKLVARILQQPTSFWSNCLVARVLQVSTSKSTSELNADDLLPAWILKLRSKTCLQDTWGNYREPADLLRRTPETEALLDVESFVRAELDIEAVRPLLAAWRARHAGRPPATARATPGSRNGQPAAHLRGSEMVPSHRRHAAKMLH